MNKHVRKKTLPIKKFENMLRVTLFLVLFSVVMSDVVSAQNRRVSLNLENVPVMTLFGEIQKQTGYSFVINPRDVQIIGNVSIVVEQEEVTKVLDKVLGPKKYSYSYSENVFVIIPSRMEQVSLEKARTVRGWIFDRSATALPGVTVLVKGLGIGVASNEKGFFTITLPSQDSTYTLVFSFIGMKSQEVKIAPDNKKDLKIIMENDNVQINDVVVTGYGNVSRQSFTGNARTVTQEEIKKIAPTDVLKALSVLDPSFRIATNNLMGSDPNSLPDIRIRGASGLGPTEELANSLSESVLANDPNLPTFVVDGFEVNVSKIFDMDVNRIESITILKDAAATAIYGSRAANGVIVITTVAPKEGEILITYNYDLNLQVPDLSDYNLMNAREKLEAEKAAGLFSDWPWEQGYYEKKLYEIERGVDTDWLAQPVRNSANHKHYVRLEGGVKSLRYGLDFNYFGENGVMKGSYRKRFGLSFDLQYNVKRLVFRNIASYAATNSSESPYGVFSTYTTMNPYYTFIDENGELLKNIMKPTGSTEPNPLYEAHIGNYNKTKQKEFNDNFVMQYYITPKLSIKSSVSFTYAVARRNVYYSPESGRYVGLDYKGELTLEDVWATVVENNNFLYYNTMLGFHSINLMAGVNWQEEKNETQGSYLRDLPAGGFSNPQFAQEVPEAPTTTSEKTRLFGAVLSLNYTYNNIYLLDISGRLDGNSVFGTEKHFAPFWSVGIGVNIHNYSSVQEKLPWLTELKIRGSYGTTGKADFPAETARTVYTLQGGNDVYATGIGGVLTTLGNKNLEWEKTRITDMGGNLNIGYGLLTFQGTYYFRRTIDLVADMNVASSSGFTSYKANIGEVVNNGYELDLRMRLLNKNDMLLYVGGNLAANHNEIKKISDALSAYNRRIEEEYQETVNFRQTIKRPLIKYEEGASVTSIWAMNSLGIDPQTGKELFMCKDGTVGGDWIASENMALGNTEPKVNGALYLNYLWKGLSLDLYFMYTYGGQQYNETLASKIENANLENNVDKRVFDLRWQKPGDIARYKSLQDWEISTNPTSRFIQDDNTLTLQTLTLGYELPSSWVRKIWLDKVKFTFTMNDVFRASTIKQERGISYPFARAYNFAVDINF